MVLLFIRPKLNVRFLKRKLYICCYPFEMIYKKFIINILKRHKMEYQTFVVIFTLLKVLHDNVMCDKWKVYRNKSYFNFDTVFTFLGHVIIGNRTDAFICNGMFHVFFRYTETILCPQQNNVNVCV